MSAPLNAMDKIKELTEARLAHRLSGSEFLAALAPVRRNLEQAAENLRTVDFPPDFESGPALQEQALDATDQLAEAMDQLDGLEGTPDAALAAAALAQAQAAYELLQQTMRSIQEHRRG